MEDTCLSCNWWNNSTHSHYRSLLRLKVGKVKVMYYVLGSLRLLFWLNIIW